MAGLAAGLLSGDMLIAISIGIFFELLWLDLSPAGTYIPPNGQASVFLAVFLCQIFDLFAASEVPLPLILGVMAGPLAARLERLHRRRSDVSFTRLLRWTRNPKAAGAVSPGYLILMSFGGLLTGTFVFMIIVEIAGLGIIGLVNVLIAPLDIGRTIILPGLSWGLIWLAGLIGALLTVRIPRAIALLAASSILTAILILL